MQKTISDALTWRYATKMFIKDKKVPEETLNAIIEAGRMAPNAYGLQPFKLIHIVSPELREKLKTEASFGQAQVTDAGDFFVIARRTDIDEAFVDEYIKNIVETRGVTVESLEKFANSMKGDICKRDENGRAMWAGRQAYISFGMMLETAALLEVDACPMEGFMPNKVDEILELGKENLASVGYMGVGFRAEGDMYATLKKVRVAKENLVITK